MAAPPFVAAEVHPDGATLFDPAGKATRLYGGPSLQGFAASLPRPPSLATSPGALADASGALVPNPDDLAFARQAQVDARADAARGPGVHEAPAALPAELAPRGAAPVASWADLDARTTPAAAAAQQVTGRGYGSSRPLPEAPGGAGAGGPQFPGLDEGMNRYDAATEVMRRAGEALYRGGPRVAAGFSPTTRSRVTEGTASDATVAGIQDATRAAAEGRAAQIGAAQSGDQAQQSAYQQGATDLVNLLTQLSAVQRQRGEQGAARANELESQAARADNPLQRALAAVDGIFAGADAISQGRDVSAAREGAIRAPQQRAEVLRQQAYDTRAAASAGAMQYAAQATPLVGALLEARARAGQLGGQAAGRAGEATTALAQGDLEALKQRGAVEAARQGTLTAGEKYHAASGGGGPSFGQLMQYAQGLQGLGTAYANAGAVRSQASGKAGAAPFQLMVGGRAVPVDGSTPPAVVNKLYEQSEGLRQAEAALDRIEAARRKLGARALTPELLQGEDGAELRSAIQAYARNESIMEGMGTLQEADRKASESQFQNWTNVAGTIREKRAKIASTKVAITQQATRGGL